MSSVFNFVDRFEHLAESGNLLSKVAWENRGSGFGSINLHGTTYNTQFDNHKWMPKRHSEGRSYSGVYRVNAQGQGTMFEIIYHVEPDMTMGIDQLKDQSRGMRKVFEALFHEWLSTFNIRVQAEHVASIDGSPRGTRRELDGVEYIFGDVTLLVDIDDVSNTPGNTFYPDKIDEYEEHLRDGGEIETFPVSVDDFDPPSFTLTDFNHRLEAVKRLGVSKIFVEPITQSDVLVVQKNLDAFTVV